MFTWGKVTKKFCIVNLFCKNFDAQQTKALRSTQIWGEM